MPGESRDRLREGIGDRTTTFEKGSHESLKDRLGTTPSSEDWALIFPIVRVREALR
jgi:hypothetical protein